MILRLLSHLPFWFLYVLSDVLFFLAYHVFSYRKAVVRGNLARAFPQWSGEAIGKVEKAFYKNLCDVLVETLKSFTISKEQLIKRVQFLNPELLQPFALRNQSVLMLTTHQCNWEWLLLSGCLQLPFPVDALYQRLDNTWWDQWMLKSRSRMGGRPIVSDQAVRFLLKDKDRCKLIGMVADQCPRKNAGKNWASFLGITTPFHAGIEKLPQLTNFPVVFMGMERIRRGYYQVTLQLLAEAPYSSQETKVTEAYAQSAEALIKKDPANWLWSHKRWKYSKEE